MVSTMYAYNNSYGNIPEVLPWPTCSKTKLYSSYKLLNMQLTQYLVEDTCNSE